MTDSLSQGKAQSSVRSQMLDQGVSFRVADMPGADELMLRIYAAMVQKERELISERTKGALAAAKARGAVLGVDRGCRSVAGPDAGAAAVARQQAAAKGSHRLALEVERLRVKGLVSQAAIARALTQRQVPTRSGAGAWIPTTVARVLSRVG